MTGPAPQLALTEELQPAAAPPIPAPREPEPVRPTGVWRISGEPVAVHELEEDWER